MCKIVRLDLIDEYSGSICAAFEKRLHDSSHETTQKFGSCRFGYVLKILVLPLGVRFFLNRAFRPISQAFAAKGIGYLEEAVLALLSGYNLANERIRDLYNAVAGDKIQNQSFWCHFKASAKRRNDAVHGGKTITKAEADASLKAARELVAYLK